MTAFAGALDLLFADPNLTHEAWHRDCERQFTRIRIIMRRSDDATTFGAARLVSETFRFDVRVSELPAPRPDEQILFGEETFLIQGEPLRDRERLVWSNAPQIIGAHDTGPLIRSKDGFWLAIPTPAAGKGAHCKALTPGEWERRRGLRLRFIYRRRGPSL